jgi:hypothetical protein
VRTVSTPVRLRLLPWLLLLLLRHWPRLHHLRGRMRLIFRAILWHRLDLRHRAGLDYLRGRHGMRLIFRLWLGAILRHGLDLRLWTICLLGHDPCLWLRLRTVRLFGCGSYLLLGRVP